ncbi:MAG: Hsp70 family protein [Planctomycetes bacterium]|nr:Hsp70 family protein [Planctomycetota bacterium]
MSTTFAVGIDLGTTYSCIAYLNEQGEPVSIPNQEGEISTPSVVMFDKNDVVVGTEALRNAILNPLHVVQNSKRWMGDPKKKWTIDGKTYTPSDIATAILKKLVGDAQRQIGVIDRAVITVPAQFSEAQRLATVAAGKAAGLKEVNIINEPVAAALCYVLGAEGLWFSELASEQRVLVYDLGGGTFDLSLVTYAKDRVRVVASTGDLHLGGIDWNQCLLNAVAEQFAREFGDDPRRDPESLQQLAWEVEQCKRSLTVRSKAALICQHGGKRKTYQIERDQFNQLTQHLVKRTEEITRKLIDQHRTGTSHLDLTVLSAGGSSRMPMIEDMLRNLRGTTHSKALSPDQSIAHGAAYYAGMLLTNSEFVHSIIEPTAAARLAKMKQQSVNARDLGILVRDVKSNTRVPFYLIPANTPLPASVTKVFGTVVPNQKRVNLYIVESGAGTDKPYSELGNCSIEELPPNLPAESKIAVTISYDASARVEISAKDLASGRMARTQLLRGVAPFEKTEDPTEGALMTTVDEQHIRRARSAGLSGVAVSLKPESAAAPRPVPPLPTARPAAPPAQSAAKPVPAVPTATAPKPAPESYSIDLRNTVPEIRPEPAAAVAVALCEECDGVLNAQGQCPRCQARSSGPPKPPSAVPPKVPAVKPVVPVKAGSKSASLSVKPVPTASGSVPVVRKPESNEIMELPRKKPAGNPPKRPAPPAKPQTSHDPGEEEFWNFARQ